MGIVAGLFRELGKIGTLISYCIAYILIWVIYYPYNGYTQLAQVLIITISIFLLIPVKKNIKQIEMPLIKRVILKV